MKPWLTGWLAGVVATAAMTVVFFLGRLRRGSNNPPPAQALASAETHAGIDSARPAFEASWLALHFGYGGLLGLAYALMRPALPLSGAPASLAYAGLIWALNYSGVLPLLRLYPWPARDARPRLALNLIAHVVYGVALERAASLLARSK